jgi:predicted AlkP superfamily pyrophosphatase or phosphodiesterase
MHAYAFTVTSAGHAMMLTGAYPVRTGIIGNEWRHPETGTPFYSTLIYSNVVGHLLELPRSL